MVTLSKKSDPVIVRMLAGGGIRVEVVDVENMPIASATVSIPSLESVQATTDAKGFAELRNLPKGAIMVAVQADGFAKAHSLAPVPQGADNLGQQRVTLERGVQVTGRIVDFEGNPVAEASVIALRSGSFMQVQNPKSDGVKSDKDGHFELPAVPSGNVQLLAVHDEHASSTSERFDVADEAIKDVEIALKRGASVAGRVINTEGEPVGWATVRVRNPGDGFRRGQSVNRQMIADEDGTFKIKGLPREELALFGSSEEASSQSLEVDLRNKAEAQKIELLLDVDGTIEGIVTDENGAAVAEAQILAYPDFWEGADMKELRLRGPAFAISSGDGRFTIRGLPDSKYKINASRTQIGGQGGFQQGVSAKTGDRNVKVELATPATIVGTISASNGTTPAIATVSIGWGNSVPVTNGKFELSEVPPGRHDLTVRGPDFATTVRSKIEVTAGEKHDVGSIEVRAGRQVSGRVLDSKGNAIAEADVVLARQLISDGANLTPKGIGSIMDQQMGTRRTKTDGSGNYSFRGIGDSKWTIAADHPEGGRSLGKTVEKGSEKVKLDLALLQVGGVKGTVTVNGEPSAGVDVLITSETGSAHIVIVKSDEKGEFLAERVASGKFKVSAMRNAGGSSSMAATNVTVEPGAIVEASLEIEEGSIDLVVTVAGVDDAKIDAAQVFLFKGAADVHTGAELNKLFLSAAASAKMGFAMGTGKANFDKITPADYSVCIIPINGDMNDPSFAQKLQRHVDDLAVYCQRLKITDTPDKQSYKSVVPPMTPLPEE
jgi:protocatechuate 3,4-dioxygenase beta subunit